MPATMERKTKTAPTFDIDELRKAIAEAGPSAGEVKQENARIDTNIAGLQVTSKPGTGRWTTEELVAVRKNYTDQKLVFQPQRRRDGLLRVLAFSGPVRARRHPMNLRLVELMELDHCHALNEDTLVEYRNLQSEKNELDSFERAFTIGRAELSSLAPKGILRHRDGLSKALRSLANASDCGPIQPEVDALKNRTVSRLTEVESALLSKTWSELEELEASLI